MSEVLTMSGEIKYTGDVGPRGLPGIQGEKGDKPVKGVDYFTESDIQSMVNQVTGDSLSVYNRNAAQKTEEFNSHVESEKRAATEEISDTTKDELNEYNQNHTTKLEEYNTNSTNKISDYNTNAANKTTAFDENYTSKLATINQKASDFNTNYTSKLESFNTNATSKTTAFDNNATSKTSTFNTNATTKTTNFNTNASTKTSDFNTNATNKTTAFDNNASTKQTAYDNNAATKTTAFNDNAQEKLDDFNENADSYLQKDMMEKNFNTSNAVIEGSGQINNALYWDAKRVNKFGGGQVSQDTTTGKNKLEIAEVSLSKPDNRTKLVVLQHPIPAGTYYISWNVVSSTLSELGASSISFRKLDSTQLDYCPFSGVKHRLTFTETVEQIYFYISNSEADGVAIEVNNMQIEEGTTGTDYEQFTNGASPNPDYEQPIKMLTGNVNVEESNKNFFSVNGRLASGTIDKYKNGFKLNKAHNRTLNIYLPQICQAGNYKLNYNIISSTLSSINKLSVSVQLESSQLMALPFNSAGEITISASGEFNKLYFYIVSSEEDTAEITLDNVMLRLASAEDDTYIAHEGQTFPLTLPADMYLGDLGTASNFIFKNEKGSPYYNSSLVENANYWHKKWKIYEFTGDESGNYSTTGTNNIFWLDNLITNYFVGSGVSCKSNFFIGRENVGSNNAAANINNSCCFRNSTETRRIYFCTNNFATLNDFKSWLAEKYQAGTPVYLCYELETEENILIEDTTLNTQLDTMWENMKTYGITNFVITGGDINGKLDLDYYVDDRIEQNQEIADIKSALLSLGANI